jgi:SagB-type dehydrogenase family enzyme
LRYVRSHNLVLHWEEDQLVLEEFVKRERSVATPLVALVLDAFSKPRSATEVASSLKDLGRKAVHDIIGQLREHGFLVPETKRGPKADISEAWFGSFAAAYYHFATRDVVYAANPFEWFEGSGERLTAIPCPPVFKDFRRARYRPMPSPPPGDGSLETALRNRRTTRGFLGTSVPWRSFADIIGGSFGKTGFLDAGILGKLLAKTSPSAGARHPIECYVLAWNVSELEPGLYHYSVRQGGLELLRAGDFRKRAVRAASGQEWVAQAAFLCVLTVLVNRVFWKYPSSDAYRLFFLDAGHIAQTFCLLATAAGLGAFTTAAIQESFLERLLGINGVDEFPVYLCGAGVPDPDSDSTLIPAIR